MEEVNGVEVRLFEDAARWEAWLADHHDRPVGVWLKLAKKDSGKVSVTRAEATEVALCYGWIDSQARSYDDAYHLQKFTRRRPRSLWSKINIDRVEALIAAGRMRAPGLAEVEAAKADGRWDAAYESPKNATVPPDLTTALAANQRAREFFESLGRSDRYLVLHRLMTARTPAGRAARLQRLIAMLESGKKLQ